MKSGSFALENDDNDDDDDNYADLMIIKKSHNLYWRYNTKKLYDGGICDIRNNQGGGNTYVIESLIILYITKTESNNCFIILIE